MLNILWPSFLIISIIYAILSGNLKNINNSIFESANSAVNLCITLLGTMCLWNGIMQIASKTTAMKKKNHKVSKTNNKNFISQNRNKY